MQFAAIDEVKYLHHNKCVKYKGKMSRIDMELFEYGRVIHLSI